jgi:hypothetical protein
MSSLNLNAWQSLPVQPPEPLWPKGEQMTFSPSGMGTFAICPRQFYYSHWLKLKAASSWASLKGTWIHWLLERLAKPEWRHHPAVRQRFSKLAIACLDPDLPADFLISSELALDYQNFCEEASFSQAIQAGTKLQRQRLLLWTQNSLVRLEEAGFFERARLAQAWYSEVVFEPKPWHSELLSHNEKQSASLLTGTADVLMQDQNGQWVLLDYKSFGPNRLSQKSLQKRLDIVSKVLNPPDLTKTKHRERFPLQDNQPALYQLPAYYYLATQQAPLCPTGQQTCPPLAVGVQIVRPEPDVSTLALEPELLAEETSLLLSTLHQAMVGPLQEGDLPEAIVEKQSCSHCGIRRLCAESA